MARTTSQNSGASDFRYMGAGSTTFGTGPQGLVNSKATNADADYWKSVFPGWSNAQITQHLQSLPLAQQQKYLEGAAENKNKVFNPESGLDRWMGGIALAMSLATAGGAGATLAPALVGAAGGVGSLGGIAAGAGVGSVTGATTAGLSGGNIGKGALLGALGGGFGASGLGQSLSNSTGLSPTASNAIVKGAVGAGGAALTGGNPLAAGVSGVAGGFGVPSGIANIVGRYAGGSGGSTAGGGSSFLGAGVGAGGMATAGQGMATATQGGTDSTLAGTITGALPGLIQGAAGVYGSQNAAEKMTQADQNAIGTQTSTLGNINDIWKTQQGLGQGADKALGSALGTNGQPADYSGFENMPGYKFAVSQGTQAIQRQAASMGNAYTPNTAEAVGQYVTGTAAQDYNTYISQLMGAAGLGNSANQGIANPTYQTGANISQLQQNQGYAQASGVSGAANAVGGMFGPNGVGSSLIGAAGRYLGGGGSNGGGSGGSNGGGGRLFNGPMSNWNQTGAGNGTWGSGYDPNTGGSWVSQGGTDMPTYDPSNFNTDFGGGMDYGSVPTMPGIEGGSTDFGGGLDYGSDSLNFLNFG